MTIQKHTHKFKRHRYKSGSTVYFCTLDCTFKIETQLAIGKVSLCNICNREFVMTELSIRLVRPHCSDCAKVKVLNPETGKKHYIRKQVVNVTDAIADNEVSNLKGRLSQVVTMESDEEI